MKIEELLAVWCALAYMYSRMILPQRGRLYPTRKYMITHMTALDPVENAFYNM